MRSGMFRIVAHPLQGAIEEQLGTPNKFQLGMMRCQQNNITSWLAGLLEATVPSTGVP